MRFFRASSALAALLCATAVPAQEPLPPWSDEAIWQTVGETYGIERQLRGMIFRTQAVRDQMRRVGVETACGAIDAFIDRKEQAAQERYRPLVIRLARNAVGEGSTFADRASVMPSGHRFARLLAAAEREQPDLFAAIYMSVESELVRDLAAMAAIGGEWRGPVSDWTFDGGNPFVWSASCLVASSGDPTNAKRVFDGFFQTPPAR